MIWTYYELEMGICELKEGCEEYGDIDPDTPLIVFNSDFYDYENLAIPPKIASYLKEEKSSFQIKLVGPDAYISPIVPFTPMELQNFTQGTPILFLPISYQAGNTRSRGGQDFTKTEEEIKSVLNQVAHSVIERFSLLAKAKEKHKKSAAFKRREDAIEEIADFWIASSLTSPGKAACQAKLNTLHSRATKVGYIPYHASDEANLHFKNWAERVRHLTSSEIQNEKNFLMSQVVSLLRCQRRAEQLRILKGDHAEAIESGNLVEKCIIEGIERASDNSHLELIDALPAAFAGAPNPAEICGNLKVNKALFETVKILGDFSRGYDRVEFTTKQTDVLKNAIRSIDASNSPSFQEDETQTVLATFWKYALTAKEPLSEWKRQLAEQNK